jgi:3-carboxy-cis,cis-muconate cycloisomerase
MSEPIDGLFTTPAMAAVFSAETHVRHVLAFEAALAMAEARAEVIPPSAAVAIAAACRVDQFNVVELFHEAATAGTVVIPLVRRLTAQISGEAQSYVHWGATSQDAIDTAAVLQMREGLDLLVASLLEVCERCAALAVDHRRTLMAGRTLLQQALPITFGLRAARWLALATRQVVALRRCRRSLVLQFGGAAGTLAALGNAGLRVGELLAEELGLPLPDLPWHAERDRLAAIAAALGVAAGAMAKIAYDVVLLAQTEVGEVAEAEAPGKGGSSALPHKCNPVDAVTASAAARLAIGVVPVILSAMANEHERAAGGWQAEWAAVPDLFRFAAGAVARVESAVRGLRVDERRMSSNLELGGRLLMAEALTVALTPQFGRAEARRLVEEVCRRGLPLTRAARDDERIRSALTTDGIDRALDPVNYLGSTDALIDRALESYRQALAPHEAG